MTSSEVARLREDIANAYLAAQWGLSGLAFGVSQHQFITVRMQRMQEGHQQLETLLGEEAVIQVSEMLNALPQQPTRAHLLNVLSAELGQTEETYRLEQRVQEMWSTLDLLRQRFGAEVTQVVLDASPVEMTQKGNAS